MVIIAKRIHLFPFRTQKLSSLAAMVLGGRPPGRVARSHVYSKVAQWWSTRLLTDRLRVRVPPLEPRKYAEVAELADAQDLKSCETYTFVPVRFRSSAPYFLYNIAEWSSWQLVGLITRRSQVQVLSPQPFK